MKYLHIMHNEKFNKAYIDFINNNFNPEEHLFLFLGGSKTIEIPNYKNTVIGTNKGGLHRKINWSCILFKYCYKVEKIFLHGLWNSRVVNFLFFNPFLVKKCNWILWGGDLYTVFKEKKNLKEKWKEFKRKKVIKRFDGFVTGSADNYALLKKYYGVSGKWYRSFLYPSNLYREIPFKEKKEGKTVIQIANSSKKRNNHIEILNKLVKYKDEDIEIICPLSYPDKENAVKVRKYGEKIFGDKFIGLTELLEYEKYIELLSRIDIAIFNHTYPQGMGNILKLLGMGKKVYLNGEDYITMNFMKNYGFNIFDTQKEITLDKIPNDIAIENINTMKKNFSVEKLVDSYREIFNK